MVDFSLNKQKKKNKETFLKIQSNSLVLIVAHNVFQIISKILGLDDTIEITLNEDS
jgi:hypothetical protein